VMIKWLTIYIPMIVSLFLVSVAGRNGTEPFGTKEVEVVCSPKSEVTSQE
jgi:hypothetical protein